jgi:heme-degrading monooxygenase HmoA
VRERRGPETIVPGWRYWPSFSSTGKTVNQSESTDLRARIANTKGDSMSDVRPAIMLIVRGLKSGLPRAEFERRYKERLPQFRDVKGLVQKYYSYDESTGEWAGIYLWDSEESLAEYLESDLRKSIASAYELTQQPRFERFRIVDVLRVPAQTQRS